MSLFHFKRYGATRHALRAAALVLSASFALSAFAQTAPAASAPESSPPVALRLQDFFQMPVGPKGLVISERLRQAQGRQVRITGYVVQQEVATLGQFLLTPRPVLMSQHADGEADDLPPATVFVRLDAEQQDWAVAHARGLVEVTGTLEVGRQEERDGRVSWFRLQLAPEAYAAKHKDTLVIVTADHECAGVALIGGSKVSDARLQALVREGGGTALRDAVVGVYEQAGFPKSRMAADGYPETVDIDNRLLVGYGANADRMEDFRTNERPLQDSQQPFVKKEPLAAYPAGPMARDAEGKYMVTGQVPGDSAVHTATDIPLSAFGPGAYSFTGVIDNTDVFFKLAQAATRGVVLPEGLVGIHR